MGQHVQINANQLQHASLASNLHHVPVVADTLRLGNLDLLRFCAAMIVVLYHLTYTGHAANGLSPTAFPELLPLTQHRWAGAWLFFMVSGFGISYAARHGSAYKFLVARVARIYPTFLFCMCLTSIVLLLAAPQNFVEFQMTFTRWFANLTMAPKLLKQSFVDGVYWSIVVEIIFYLGVGFFLSRGLFHKRQLTILTLWLGFSFLNEFWLDNALLSKFITRNSCFFAFGMLSYRVFEAKRKPEFKEIALGILALVLALKSDYSVNSWLVSNLNYAAEWNAWYALTKTLGFLALMNIAVRVEPIMDASRSSLLGSISFPLYLLHSSIGFVMFHHLDGVVNRWVALTVIYISVLAMAYAVARFIEPRGRAFVWHISGKGLSLRLGSAERRLPIAQSPHVAGI